MTQWDQRAEVTALQAENAALRESRNHFMEQRNVAYERIEQLETDACEIVALREALAEFVRDGYSDPTDPAVIRARELLGKAG